MSVDLQSLVTKIRALPPESLEEVADFVDFIATRERDRASTRAAAQSSAPVFGKIWNNPDDDVYDAI